MCNCTCQHLVSCSCQQWLQWRCPGHHKQQGQAAIILLWSCKCRIQCGRLSKSQTLCSLHPCTFGSGCSPCCPPFHQDIYQTTSCQHCLEASCLPLLSHASVAYTNAVMSSGLASILGERAIIRISILDC